MAFEGTYPTGGSSPVTAINKTRCRVTQTSRLNLRQANRRVYCSYFSRAATGVIAEPIDIDAVGRCNGVDFERDRLATIHANVRGESLDARISNSNIPFSPHISGQGVFADDRIGSASLTENSNSQT